MTSFWWLLPIALLAAAGSACAWLILSKTPAVDTAPPAVDDTAVETPEAGAVIPQSPPASGAPDFDLEIDQALAIANSTPTYRPWLCTACRCVFILTAAQARDHQLAHWHAADFAEWARELDTAAGGNNDRSNP